MFYPVFIFVYSSSLCRLWLSTWWSLWFGWKLFALLRLYLQIWRSLLRERWVSLSSTMHLGYMNDTISDVFVCIRYSTMTVSFHFILEIECNLTCEHDGICAKDHNDDLQCFCPQGYSGQYCEHGNIIHFRHSTHIKTA